MQLFALRPSRSGSDSGGNSNGTLRHRTSLSALSNVLSSRPRNPYHSPNASLAAIPEPDLRDLNNSLHALAEIFPDVRPDVFREMLSSLSDDSRLHVVADQLLNSGAKWIQGRWRISFKIAHSRILTEVLELEGAKTDNTSELVPVSEHFRSKEYKSAVRTALMDEFNTLSRTTIEGVLAEQNFSYTNSRPVLSGLAAKSWRISLKALMVWKKKPDTHFMLAPAKAPSAGGLPVPQLKRTASAELDEELYHAVLKPLLEQDANTKESISQELAILLNHADAKDNGAVFECECCFDEVAFESIAVCSQGDHFLCFSCVQKAIYSALYAQTWSMTVDQTRSALCCFAPSESQCPGCIPNHLTQRALSQTRGGAKTWSTFEQKLATEARSAAGGKYQECPFCTYAELDEVFWPTGSLQFRFNWFKSVLDLLSMLLKAIFCIILYWQYFWLSLALPLTPPQVLLDFSLAALARRSKLSLKFQCQHPECQKSSCRVCHVQWRDPHKCNEKEEISLRTSIEAAKSAATKRVCPKCNVAFVKESGCNKMTCTCGYTMCYLCRQGLGQSTNKDNPHDDHDYSHFCDHFRAFPGQCTQCDKCDLYREGNQEEIIRKAGVTAEKEWRAGQRREKSADAVLEVDTMESKLQSFVDGMVETFVTC